MTALPSLPLESPLLLLLPSVPVVHVRLHSGLSAPGYFASAANGMRSSRWWGGGGGPRALCETPEVC